MRASSEIAFCLQRNIVCAVHSQRDERDNTCKHGVPVQHTGIRARAKIGPQRFKKGMIRLKGNSANYVSESSAEEDGEQQTADRKQAIEEVTPNLIFKVHAEFDPDSSQD